ncbi:FHIPEP family type III secretion protein, partial [Enterococcus gallinarum]|uniref:FHIPEP family type III secretion protein n=1 Tax=Enterococcus gallinarum TaxID=1353 RepID=UPI003D0F4F05
DLGTVVAGQLSSQKRALQIAGGAALALCLVPGLPKLPFLLVGGGLVFLGQRMASAAKDEIAAVDAPAVMAGPAPD